MLTVRLAHPKPSLPSLLSLAHISAPQNRVIGHNSSFAVLGSDYQCQRHHSSHCWLGSGGVGSTTKRIGAASVWHAILPTSGNGSDHYLTRTLFHRQEKRGEGSWNVAWDARPARWLHWPDSVWLLFGVCACLGVPQPHFPDITHDLVTVADNIVGSADDFDSKTPDISPNYSVTGVPADGRCLFRAIAHVACLRNGEEAPDENRQRELADKLRAQVVDELIKRRKEAEWFIEGDFDAYVKRIQQPYVWGGEPELLMASHVVKAPISVFMVDRSSGNLMNIANYGEEYQKDEVHSINVLFHGYGHYDILESIPDQSNGK